MGIFSFLKDKNTAAAEAPAPMTPAAEPVAPAAPVTTTSAGTPNASQHDSSFVRPAAWDAPLDTSALVAPPEPEPETNTVGPLDPANTTEMQQSIIDTIKTVFDPEIPVDIYELGLIYDIIVDAEKRVLINMTLTSPACPSAQQIPNEVRWKVKAVPGVTDAWVEIAWEPMWTKDRMSEAAKLQLGFF